MWLVATAWDHADKGHLLYPRKLYHMALIQKTHLVPRGPFLPLFTATEIFTPSWWWRELGLLEVENFLGAMHLCKMRVPQICDIAQGTSNQGLWTNLRFLSGSLPCAFILPDWEGTWNALPCVCYLFIVHHLWSLTEMHFILCGALHVSPVSDDEELRRLWELTCASRAVIEIIISMLSNHYNWFH